MRKCKYDMTLTPKSRHSGLSGIGSKIQNDSRRAACGELAGMTVWVV